SGFVCVWGFGFGLLGGWWLCLWVGFVVLVGFGGVLVFWLRVLVFWVAFLVGWVLLGWVVGGAVVGRARAGKRELAMEGVVAGVGVEGGGG
ncbi:hypothetical protein, partial [Pseudomonas syringae group genomosp. 7]|uniref:hypothetical protein n=1 Tax=Pseudomonas syringae group genomosp. 7 TaxID=251699 RepID=UPI00376FB8C0